MINESQRPSATPRTRWRVIVTSFIMMSMLTTPATVEAFPAVSAVVGRGGAESLASQSASAFGRGRATAVDRFQRLLRKQQQQSAVHHGRHRSSSENAGDSSRVDTSARDRRFVSMTLPSRRASIAIFAAGMVLGGCLSSPVTSNFRLYRTVPDIPPSMFQNHATLGGTVVGVSDGDSIRVRHKPTVPLPLPGRKMEGKTSEETLQIRLYAVDCPEVAHFGNPAQPFSKEAKDFTKEILQGQDVKVKLLSMDQYNRAVCRVQYGRWPFQKDVSAELLKNGLGVLYRQGGAQYDGQQEKLADFEAKAKKSKEGLWQKANGETPAQYKARVKRGEKAAAT